MCFNSAEGEIRTLSPVKDDGFQDRASSPLRYLGLHFRIKNSFLISIGGIRTRIDKFPIALTYLSTL